LTKARIIEEVEAKRRLQMLEDQQRNLSMGQNPGRSSGIDWSGNASWGANKYDVWADVIGAAAGVLFHILRRR
jgi:hypothetical protein